MVDSSEINSGDMLPVYNYRVSLLNSDGPTPISFSEVSGLSIEYEPVTYKHGMSFAMGARIIPGMRQPIRVTFKRGITRSRATLKNWFTMANAVPVARRSKFDIEVALCDPNGNVVVRWLVMNALPVRLDAPEFNAAENAIAIETLEVIAGGVVITYDEEGGAP